MVTQSERRAWPWYTWPIGLMAITALVWVAVAVWNTFTPAPSSSFAAAAPSTGTQTNEGGQVTVKATWNGASAGPVFDVALDTHAVDLDGFDLAQLAVLRADGGREVRPTGWDAPKGGHHRSGRLTFPTTTADGTTLISAGTRTVELVIRGVAGVPERVFVWRP